MGKISFIAGALLLPLGAFATGQSCHEDLCCFDQETYAPSVCASVWGEKELRKNRCPKGYTLAKALRCTGREIHVPRRGEGASNRQRPAPGGSPPIIPGPGIPCTADLCLCAADGSNVGGGGYCN